MSSGLQVSHGASAARYVYNWALGRCQQYYRQHGKSKPWGERSAELTERKRTQPWLYDFDAQMLQQALADLERAYANFFARRAQKQRSRTKPNSPQSQESPAAGSQDPGAHRPSAPGLSP